MPNTKALRRRDEDQGAMVDAVLTAVPVAIRVDAPDLVAPRALEDVLAVPPEAAVADLAPDLAPVLEVRSRLPAALRTFAGIPPRLRPAMDAVRGVMIGVMAHRNS